MAPEPVAIQQPDGSHQYFRIPEAVRERMAHRGYLASALVLPQEHLDTLTREWTKAGAKVEVAIRDDGVEVVEPQHGS